MFKQAVLNDVLDKGANDFVRGKGEFNPNLTERKPFLNHISNHLYYSNQALMHLCGSKFHQARLDTQKDMKLHRAYTLKSAA